MYFVVPNNLSSFKLSHPASGGLWEIPVLHLDEHLLAVAKPAGIWVTPDRRQTEQPALMPLLDAGIKAGKAWAAALDLDYLHNAHRLEFDTTGVLLLARSKPALTLLTEAFGSGKVDERYTALIRGVPPQETFELSARLSPHPDRTAVMRVDPRAGRRYRTRATVRERFKDYALIECRAMPGKPGQIAAHLRHARHPLVGDPDRGGKLFLSKLKRDYHLNKHREERPLIGRTALHLEAVALPHPVTGEEITFEAPLPKDLSVALKYLRRFGQ